MLIWVFVAITLVCIATVIVMDLKGFDFDYHIGTGVIATIITGVLIVAVIIMTGIACVTNITADSYAAEMEQRYKSLTYQLENDMYDNENEYGKKGFVRPSARLERKNCRWQNQSGELLGWDILPPCV